MFLFASPVPQTGVPMSVTQHSSLSVLVVVVRAWPLASSASEIALTSKKTWSLWESRFPSLMKMPSLKACSTVKVDRFEVARCSSMYKITDHPFLIRFISLTIIDEVITGARETILQSIRLFDNLQVIANTNLELPS
uniref:Uncharacterized protein n=1 Tax=Brassica oleracea var. oleracea TaxID=109376 RepID=A0A0D3CVE3_BRAOL